MMLASELLAGYTHNCDNIRIGGIVNDTRKLRAGDMFIAISGAAFDGHDFIAEALRGGASCIVSERPLGTEIPHLTVGDTKLVQAELAARYYGRPADKLVMTAATGTNGKTTVTHILKELLTRAAGIKSGLIGTNSVIIGAEEQAGERTTPDSIELQRVLRQMADAGCSHCVMEASSHALVQKRTAGIGYRVGIFTNLTRDHLDYHKDMESYFEAKKLLFEQSDAAIINEDDEYGKRLEHPNKISYAIRGEGDIMGRNVTHRFGRVELDIGYGSRTAHLIWHTPGMFSAYNALAAASAALALGVELSDIVRIFPAIQPVKGRMEQVHFREGVTVLIDYAHTPDALDNVLREARAFTKGRLIVLFGCGGDRDRSKRPLMGKIAEECSDIAVVTTDNPRSEEPESIIDEITAAMTDYKAITDRTEAIEWALTQARQGDTVILAGKGHETYQEINGVRKHYDEREIVKRYA